MKRLFMTAALVLATTPAFAAHPICDKAMDFGKDVFAAREQGTALFQVELAILDSFSDQVIVDMNTEIARRIYKDRENVKTSYDASLEANHVCRKVF